MTDSYAFHGRAPLLLLAPAAAYFAGWAVGAVIAWGWRRVAR